MISPRAGRGATVTGVRIMRRVSGLLVPTPVVTVPVVTTMLGALLLTGCTTTIPGTPAAGAGAPPGPGPASSPPVPSGTAAPTPPQGTATLDDPTIGTARRIEGVDFCTLLTPEDIAQATGLTQEGPPSLDFLCSIDYAEGGFVFVSDIGADTGEPVVVGGNSAILVRDDENSCQVTVALGPDAAQGNVLDIDSVVLAESPVPVCDGVLELARRALNRLPPA